MRYRSPTARVIEAYGEMFRGSLAAAMGTTPAPVYVPPARCYWFVDEYRGCQGEAITTFRYPELGAVDVCADCARFARRFKFIRW